ALLIGVYDGGKLRYVGRVGTGFSSQLLGDLFKKLKKLRAKSSPFDKPPKEKGTVWLKPKLVAEVEYKTISRDGIFRQTSFKGLRLDKSPQGIGLEQPAADASTVKITHPRRIVFPKTKTAKIDVVNYYREVAPL